MRKDKLFSEGTEDVCPFFFFWDPKVCIAQTARPRAQTLTQ